MTIRGYYVIRICILIIGLLSFHLSYGQKDKIFLKNGSVVKGDLIKADGERVYAAVGKGQLDLMIEDIRYIKFSKAKRNDDSFNYLTDSLITPYFVQGFGVLVSTGLQFGAVNSNESTKGTWSSQAVLMYKILPRMLLGISVGYDQYDVFNAAPVSFYYQADIAKGPGGFFGYSSIGISKMWYNGNGEINYSDVSGGMLLQVGLGHAWHLKNTELITTLGWKRQKVDSSNDRFWDWGGNEFVVGRSINRIEAKIGIGF